MNTSLALIVIISILLNVSSILAYLTTPQYYQHSSLSHSYILNRHIDTLTHETAFQAGAAVINFTNLLSIDTLSCLRQKGFAAAIPRAYQSSGHIDPNMVINVANARQSGFRYVDVSMTPCPKCTTATSQVTELWSTFSEKHVDVGMVWITIEGTMDNWTTIDANVTFMKEIVAQFQSFGAKIGIYSSKYEWISIFGAWELPGNYPLWYPREGNPSCYDFHPFGGFKSAVLKRFESSTNVCDGIVDFNSYC